MSPAIEDIKTGSAGIGLNAQKIASKRYSLKDQQGHPIEEWPAIVRRVVTHVSAAENDSSKREDFYEIGHLRLDFKNSEFTSQERRIELSEREVRLLRYLVRHRGEVAVAVPAQQLVAIRAIAADPVTLR